MQLASAEVERRLRLFAPDFSDGVIRDMIIGRRARATPIACPSCSRPMQPVAMIGVKVARCNADDQIWFDASKFDRIVELTSARHQSQRSWLSRLRSHLFAS